MKTKTSTKLLAGAFGIVLIAVLACIISFRIWANDHHTLSALPVSGSVPMAAIIHPTLPGA